MTRNKQQYSSELPNTNVRNRNNRTIGGRSRPNTTIRNVPEPDMYYQAYGCHGPFALSSLANGVENPDLPNDGYFDVLVAVHSNGQQETTTMSIICAAGPDDFYKPRHDPSKPSYSNYENIVLPAGPYGEFGSINWTDTSLSTSGSGCNGQSGDADVFGGGCAAEACAMCYGWGHYMRNENLEPDCSGIIGVDIFPYITNTSTQWAMHPNYGYIALDEYNSPIVPPGHPNWYNPAWQTPPPPLGLQLPPDDFRNIRYVKGCGAGPVIGPLGDMLIYGGGDWVIGSGDGDVNFDGQVNITDIVIIMNNVLGFYAFSEEEFLAADANQDGNIDVADILTIITNILGESLTSQEQSQIMSEVKRVMK